MRGSCKSRYFFSKGQSSFEYMTVVGFAFLLVIPIIILFYTNLYDMQDNVNSAQINSVAESIVRTVDKMFYMGTPASETIKVTYPVEFNTISINSNTTLYMSYTNANNVNIPVYKQSVANMQGAFALNSGVHYLKIEAMDGYVMITDVS